MDRVGRQSPTVSVILPYEDTKGPEAIEQYNASENTALDWQVALTYDIMATNEEGLWIHQKFGYSVSRRNGKSEMALARCIWGLKNGEQILEWPSRNGGSFSQSSSAVQTWRKQEVHS